MSFGDENDDNPERVSLHELIERADQTLRRHETDRKRARSFDLSELSDYALKRLMLRIEQCESRIKELEHTIDELRRKEK